MNVAIYGKLDDIAVKALTKGAEALGFRPRLRNARFFREGENEHFDMVLVASSRQCIIQSIVDVYCDKAVVLSTCVDEYMILTGGGRAGQVTTLQNVEQGDVLRPYFGFAPIVEIPPPDFQHEPFPVMDELHPPVREVRTRRKRKRDCGNGVVD